MAIKGGAPEFLCVCREILIFCEIGDNAKFQNINSKSKVKMTLLLMQIPHTELSLLNMKISTLVMMRMFGMMELETDKENMAHNVQRVTS